MSRNAFVHSAQFTLEQIQRALDGDDGAFAALTRRLVPVIRARAWRRLKLRGWRLGSFDLDDLTQEIWVALIRNGGRQLMSFDPTRGMTLEGFVGLVAEREIGNLTQRVDAKKRGGNRRLVERGDDASTSAVPSPEDVAVTHDLAVRLGAHLDDRLPARGRLVLRLAFADGHPAHQVAEVMGVSPQVVYNWQHKIRALSRAFLA